MAARGPAQVFIKLIVMPGALSSAAQPWPDNPGHQNPRGRWGHEQTIFKHCPISLCLDPDCTFLKGLNFFCSLFLLMYRTTFTFSANHLAFCMDLNGVLFPLMKDFHQNEEVGNKRKLEIFVICYIIICVCCLTASSQTQLQSTPKHV